MWKLIRYTLGYINSGDSVRNKNGIAEILNIYKEPIGYLWFLYILFFIFSLNACLSIFIKLILFWGSILFLILKN